MKYREEIYIEENGEKIYGEKISVIINNNGYYLSYIVVFKNGLIHFNCEFLGLEQIKTKIKDGRLLQNIPDNVELEYEDLGTIQSAQFTPEKSDADFIKEIEDLINTFNNCETRSTICENAFKNYLIEPTVSNLSNLKDKYNDLPSHQRVLFEYVDFKDPLCCFMKEEEIYTVENRKEILKHYFKIEL